MMLTPFGSEQHIKFGHELWEMYQQLYTNTDSIRAYSSNTSRTIMSLMALMSGFNPSIMTHIFTGSPTEEYLRSTQNCEMGVRLWIEKIKTCDPLFHYGKCDSKGRQWKMKNMERSPILQKLSQCTEVQLLLDKLYTMTNSTKLNPHIPYLSRLLTITDYITFVKYAEYHNVPLLPNPYGLSLSREEIALILELGSQVHAHQFRPWNNNRREERGKQYTSMMMSEVVRFFESGDEGIRLFSCHDTNLLALASCLGLIIPSPNFASYFIFELYDDGMVGMRLNIDPVNIPLFECPLVSINESRIYKRVEDCTRGRIPLSRFATIVSFPEYMQVVGWLTSHLNGNTYIPRSNLSEENLSTVFGYFIRNDDSILSASELYYMTCKFEIPCSLKDVQRIFPEGISLPVFIAEILTV